MHMVNANGIKFSQGLALDSLRFTLPKLEKKSPSSF
jgi:hypothetical protein